MAGSPVRPTVAVVMPFAGTSAEARTGLAALDELALRPGDAVVLADNSGTAPSDPRVVPAPGERSPAHARNVGAAAVTDVDWLLFIDADCRPTPGLLDAFLLRPIPADVGALAGEIRPAALRDGAPLAARYGVARNFLDSGAHLAHPFRPRVASANLLVRRAAFDEVGGFQEGIRTAEDTDLSWRLQAAGWRLDLAPEAWVLHDYRSSLRHLRAQWRGYAAGRAWLARRHPGFAPQPALLRAARRRRGGRGGARGPAGPASSSRAFVALDVMLGLDELVGLMRSNRAEPDPVIGAAGAVLVAEPHPVDAATDGTVRIEAGARIPGPRATNPVESVTYREDDGPWDRVLATARLAVRHPGAVVADRRLRAGGPSLRELAPVVDRLGDREVTAVADPGSERIAGRLRALQ